MSTDIVPAGEAASATSLAIDAPKSVAIAAAQARELAEVHAMMAFSKANPRNLEAMRQNMLAECSRPTFAEKAVYDLPFGGESVRGPTIRFAEGAMRHLENCSIDATLISSTSATSRVPGSETWRCTLKDFQSVRSWSLEVTVERSVERHSAKGRHVYYVRTKANGDTVNVVEPSEAEYLGKKNSAISKTQRNLILKWLGPDLLEECAARIRDTLARDAADNLEARRRSMIDAFATIGVSVSELERVAKQPLDTLSPQQVVDLRAIYNGIRDGVATWADVLEAYGLAEVSAPDDGEPKPTDAGKSLVERLKARASEQKTEPAPAPSAKAPSAPELAAKKPTKSRKELLGEVALLLKSQVKQIAESVFADYLREKGVAKVGDLTDAQIDEMLNKADERLNPDG